LRQDILKKIPEKITGDSASFQFQLHFNLFSKLILLAVILLFNNYVVSHREEVDFRYCMLSSEILFFRAELGLAFARVGNLLGTFFFFLSKILIGSPCSIYASLFGKIVRDPATLLVVKALGYKLEGRGFETS
jgi:hypothetical protein